MKLAFTMQKTRTAGCVLGLLLVLSAGQAFAESSLNAIVYPSDRWAPGILKRIEKGPNFLPRDFKDGVPPPPANDSAETRKDLDAMLEMQAKERTEDQVKQIKYEEDNLIYDVMMAKTGFADKATYPKLYKFRDTIADEVVFFILRDKQVFNRARPYQLEPKLTMVIETPHHSAYPSGHAAQTYTVALLLTMFDPDNKDYYETLARDVAHRREIAGVHFPGDAVASRILAKNVVDTLMTDSRIKAMYDGVLEEVRQHPPAKKQ